MELTLKTIMLQNAAALVHAFVLMNTSVDRTLKSKNVKIVTNYFSTCLMSLTSQSLLPLGTARAILIFCHYYVLSLSFYTTDHSWGFLLSKRGQNGIFNVRNDHAACCARKGKMSRDESAQALTQELGNSPAACQAKESNLDNWITVQHVSRPATNYRQ